MPLLKIFVDESLGREAPDAIVDLLPALREMLCRELKVDPSFCQFSVIAFRGLPDQALVSAEIHIMPSPERTRDHIAAVCEQLKSALATAVDVKTAVRATTLDPDKYLALR